MVEHLTFNQGVMGSSPIGRTKLTVLFVKLTSQIKVITLKYEPYFKVIPLKNIWVVSSIGRVADS